MAVRICSKCGQRGWYNDVKCRSCGTDLYADLVKIDFDNSIEEKVDTIFTWTKKATKKQIEEGVVKNAGARVKYYHNCSTGVQGTDLLSVMTGRGLKFWERKGKRTYGIYPKYDKKNDMMNLIFCWIDSSPLKPGDIRHWTRYDDFHVTRDKQMYYSPGIWSNDPDTGGYCYHPVKLDYYESSKYLITNLGFDICKYEFINEVDSTTFDDFMAELEPMLPENKIVALTGNKMISIDSPITYTQYLRTTASLKKKGGPKQEKIDLLTAIDLKEVEIPDVVTESNCGTREFSKLTQNVETFAVLERVNRDTPTCVIRTFSKIPGENLIREGYRLYVEGKNVYTCKPREDGVFIYTPLYTNPMNWNFSLAEFNEEDTKGTLLEYFGEVVQKIPCEIRSRAIWAFIKWPIIEQLYKAGYFNIMNWVLFNSNGSNPWEMLERTFGRLTDDKKFLKKLGVNSEQLTYVNDHPEALVVVRTNWGEHDLMSPFTFIKDILDNRVLEYYERRTASSISIAGLDIETFQMYVDFIIEYYKILGVQDIKNENGYLKYEDMSAEYGNYWNYFSDYRYFPMIFKNLIELYSPETAKSMMPSLLTLIKKKVTLGNRRTNDYYYYDNNYQSNAVSVYNDYLNMVKQLGTTSSLRPKFRDLDNLVDMHDSTISILNLQRDRIKVEQWDKRCKEIKRWEFEDKELGYKVIAPKAPTDLSKEGHDLCHCVKSYIDRVANGTTNIMFIRKIEDEETCFFTVEVSNEGYIEQVHGLRNINVDGVKKEEPNLGKFVHRWAKAQKLKETNFNKVR